MRLHRPRAGFVLAWGGELDERGAVANGPSECRRDLDAALDAEAAAYGRPPPAASSAGWAPPTPDLLQRVREGLSRYLDPDPAGRQRPTGKEVIGDGDADCPP